MATQSNLSSKTEADLATAVARYYADPLGFVMFAYPWGVMYLPDGSLNPLRGKKGPEPWQRRLLIKLGEHIKNNIDMKQMAAEFDYYVWRSARVSGHGVGKSAIVAWIIQFLMSTRPDTRGTVTANTQNQLETKTWPELGKWHNLLINKHWFTWTATAYYFSQYPDDKRKNYMVTAATVSAENTEAFAGLHNEAGTVFVIADEASGIDDKVFEVAQGALTDGEGFLFLFGNPTQPTGYFADCFDKYEHMFDLEHVDSRDVSHTNKQSLLDIINMYGGIHEDGSTDDRIKVRVLGQFPSQAFNGFISTDVVNDAIQRELTADSGAALIMAVDVARFGDDNTVIGFRQGRDFRSRPLVKVHGLGAVKVAKICMDMADRYQPDAIVIEGTGPGSGVIDIMRDRGYKVIEVHPGAPSNEPQHYFNKRAELWCKMRDWLVAHGCITDNGDLYSALTKILYSLDRHEQRTKMEAKEDYKSRTGLRSPDEADTLALTFGVNVVRRDSNLNRRGNTLVTELEPNQAITEYDPMTY